MFFTYEEFLNKLNTRIKSGDDFYLELLKTVIDNPSRYCGLFRLSNAKTKLIQNVTQSKEIKFGDFMEEIVTDYISKLGYLNKEKDLGFDENMDRLNADQVFVKDNSVYLVEQKIRDDHDSTKKRGQFANFIKKINLLKKKYSSYKIIAIMWFIDDALEKNKNYYKSEMDNTAIPNTELHLFYGGTFFDFLDNGKEVWDEIIEYLTKNRLENSKEIFTIPDFGNSDEIYNALVHLPRNYWKKLLSNENKYVLLRKEMFSEGENLVRARRFLSI